VVKWLAKGFAMSQTELSDVQWEKLQPFLPEPKRPRSKVTGVKIGALANGCAVLTIFGQQHQHRPLH
jgi:hypothetical protein